MDEPKQVDPQSPQQQQQQQQHGRRPSLEEVLFIGARELHEATQQRKIEFEWEKENRPVATKQDLEELEKRLSALIKAGASPQKRARLDYSIGLIQNKKG